MRNSGEAGKIETGGSNGAAPEWEDPRPWPELRGTVLHGLIGDVVSVLAPHTEADPAALLAEVLTGFANALGPGPHARVGGVRHPARLFTVVPGATAKARKGQAHADVGQVLALADPEWWRDAQVSGLASGEGLINKLRDQDGVPVEKRAFVVEPEFARVLTAAARDGSTLSPILRDAWDTGRLQVLTRKDPLLATDAHVGIVAHITVEELRARVTTTEVVNGFLNRFLFVCARRSKRLPNGGEVPRAELIRLGQAMREALKRGRRLRQIVRTPEADARWAEIYENLPDADGLLGAVTARAEAQLLRLQLVYALADSVSEIGPAHLEAALAFWEYGAASARHVFGAVLGDDVADRLLSELRAVYPRGLDRTQQSALFSRHTGFDRLETARGYLVKRELARIRREPTRGAPREVMYAVPKRPPGDLSSPVSLNSRPPRGEEGATCRP